MKAQSWKQRNMNVLRVKNCHKGSYDAKHCKWIIRWDNFWNFPCMCHLPVEQQISFVFVRVHDLNSHVNLLDRKTGHCVINLAILPISMIGICTDWSPYKSLTTLKDDECKVNSKPTRNINRPVSHWSNSAECKFIWMPQKSIETQTYWKNIH